MTYKDETTFTEKDNKEFGEPSVAFFVKNYPYQIGKEYPISSETPKEVDKAQRCDLSHARLSPLIVDYSDWRGIGEMAGCCTCPMTNDK